MARTSSYNSAADCAARTDERFSRTSPSRSAGEVPGERNRCLVGAASRCKRHQLEIELAYYPPYHSKYNPVERCWSSLERHWNGTLLIDVDAVVQWAKTMTWRGLSPIVQLATATYERGKRISKQAFAAWANRLQRSQTLPRWSGVSAPGEGGRAPSG